MSAQLTRKYDGETYYCERIENSKYEAEQKAKMMRSSAKKGVQTKVRIVKLSLSGQTKYGLFARSDVRY